MVTQRREIFFALLAFLCKETKKMIALGIVQQKHYVRLFILFGNYYFSGSSIPALIKCVSYSLSAKDSFLFLVYFKI